MGIRRKPAKRFLRKFKGHTMPMIEAKQPSSIRNYRDSDAWLWTEVAAVVIGLAFIIPTPIVLWIDLQDRELQRIAQAWETVTRSAPGNSGKGPALEYLISQEIELVGINLSAEGNMGNSYLHGVNLSGANLSNSNLSGAEFKGADLSGAKLQGANLSKAKFWGADLSGADLTGATLSRAFVWQTDLSKANLFLTDLSKSRLKNTNLSGADLENSRGLTQAHLDVACGDDKTRLPAGLTVRPCSEISKSDFNVNVLIKP